MNNELKHFLTLIRFKNLLIIALLNILIKVLLINPYINQPSLSNIDFIIYLISLIAIIAAGYIINDIYDVETDKINRPKQRVIEQKINKEIAIKTYHTLNIIGIIAGFYIAIQINKIWLGFIFVFFMFSLFIYSKEYKRKFLIGNLQIAFLTGLSIINIALFDIIPAGITNDNYSAIVFYIIFIYSFFSFIITLIREIIKDIEDIEGDQKTNLMTLAIKYGFEKTKKIVIYLIIITFCLITYIQYNLNWSWINLIIYLGIIQILLIILITNVRKSKTKSEIHKCSQLCKIIMIIGILSINITYMCLS